MYGAVHGFTTITVFFLPRARFITLGLAHALAYPLLHLNWQKLHFEYQPHYIYRYYTSPAHCII